MAHACTVTFGCDHPRVGIKITLASKTHIIRRALKIPAAGSGLLFGPVWKCHLHVSENRTQPTLKQHFFFKCHLPTRFLLWPWIRPVSAVDTPPPQSTQTKPVFHSVLLPPHLSAASLRTGSNHTAVTCDRKCAKASGNNRISLFVWENAEECMRTKQRTCLLDFIYELDSLGKGRKQRSGGDLAEPCEDDEWVVTGSPFGASAHQNKPCEQCLLGKRVCGLWSCDKRHLSPSDQMPHTDWHKTLLCLLLFILY